MTLTREEDTGPEVEDLDVVTETVINELNDLQFWFDNSADDATNYEVDVQDVVVELDSGETASQSDEQSIEEITSTEEGTIEESVDPVHAGI